MLTICYHTKKPVVYNAGTPYESRHSDFLERYIYGGILQAEKELAALEASKPDSVGYYYIHQQEPMGD